MKPVKSASLPQAFSLQQLKDQQNGQNATGQNENLKVVVRCRPPLPREIYDQHFISTVEVSPDYRKISLYEYRNIDLVPPEQVPQYLDNQNNYSVHQFTFDFVYDQNSSQEDVYNNTARNSVLSALDGFNASIIAYGQTGTGKTYTMEGFSYKYHHPNIGIIPRSVDEIFNYIQNCQGKQSTFMVRASYLQIYNEIISDLLKVDRQNLSIREDRKKGVYVEGLSEWAVRSPRDIYALIKRGAVARATASTKLNDVSSRSHAVFIITVEQMYTDDENKPKKIKVGKLNLVDLAGSERVRVSGATGQRLEECKKINQSLSALGNVISALTDPKGTRGHIPYRDSKITRLLEDSLGGNCKTTMIATISPANEAFGESLSTLKFANRAKNIKNNPIVNEDLDQRALLRRYEDELLKLRGELQKKSQNIVDQQKIQQLEEDKQRVLQAYQQRSKEYYEEIEAKKLLEEQIKALQSQVLMGGQKLEENERIKSMLEEQQRKIRQEYEQKVQDLERERQQIVQDKEESDKYKQLLLKQRDIMIALTSRLNERDESIVQYQEELDAYEKINKDLDQSLQKYAKRVIQLQHILKQNNINFPDEIDNYANYSQVTYGDQVAYNVVNDKLNKYDEKLIEMSQIIESQKYEIEQLKKNSHQNENTPNQSRTNYYQNGDLTQLQKALIEKDHLITKLRNEIQINSGSTLSQSQSSFYSQQQGFNEQQNNMNIHQLFNQTSDMKNSVDQIIQALASPNNPNSFAEVGQQLLLLQQKINGNHQLLKKATGSILKPNSGNLQHSQSTQVMRQPNERVNGKKVNFQHLDDGEVRETQSIDQYRQHNNQNAQLQQQQVQHKPMFYQKLSQQQIEEMIKNRQNKNNNQNYVNSNQQNHQQGQSHSLNSNQNNYSNQSIYSIQNPQSSYSQIQQHLSQFQNQFAKKM
ncbi:kinesin motor catalytic domain protein (macronuclear) [Tetrahymena thermophila SB210]|uniref:Kinesin-like protein n=1 Tax=Tetrahymena thermophila (strain SB210) TaxID=312017 RepID=I7M8Q9_TETTS|nr:kinesin motor catalytic domain protein [Tetrahymena thermophila SB210]EAR99491.4 kinesin motor catalytic domain protein [Tetrahymena thermophila SB210]|eukprot:XP_001019736.4 kinesin motor catalytic domain protein [Tetrahymena thermophila SB210]